MKICVFCGSKTGLRPELVEEVYQFGYWMGQAGHELVYGGGRVGLMGRLADGVLAAQGRVIGIIPTFLSTEEVARNDLSVLEMVDSMDQRKRRMLEVSDAFLSLPGGLGTLDELFEMVTLQQIGLHSKPSWILNWQGFYEPLKIQIQTMQARGFVTSETQALCHFVDSFKAMQKIIVEQNYWAR